jgi:hypothetical protein
MTGAKRCQWTTCFNAVAHHAPVGGCFPIFRLALNAMPNAHTVFQTNPAHPGLQFKKLEGEDNIYSLRIGLEYGALAVMNRDRVVWYWMGSHGEYDRLV